ncbi:MAG: hypothetical protein L0G23_03470 [Ruaniaceae bacterium]|nr:hypothetical protein [Ruaniaceae bacterium]
MSERVAQQALDEAAKGRTVLTVAHQMAAARIDGVAPGSELVGRRRADEDPANSAADEGSRTRRPPSSPS